MTRMTNRQEDTRAAVENALTSLTNASTLLDIQVRIRIKQAIDRDPRMAPLLEPVLPLLDRTQQAIGLTRPILTEVWEAGELNQWIATVTLFASPRDEISSIKSSQSTQKHGLHGPWAGGVK